MGWSSLIKSMASHFVTDAWFNEATAFFKGADLDAGASDAAQALEIVKSNVVLRQTLQDTGCPWPPGTPDRRGPSPLPASRMRLVLRLWPAWPARPMPPGWQQRHPQDAFFAMASAHSLRVCACMSPVQTQTDVSP